MRVLKIKIIGETDGKVVEDREIVVPVGREYVLKEIDKSLKDKNVGDEYELVLAPEKAYGRRISELIKLIPMKFFRQNNVNPYPGLVVNVDGLLGRVRSVSPGRVLVDFNHPLAGKTLKFKIKILEEVKDKAQIAQEIIKGLIGIECEAKTIDKKIQVKFKEKLSKELEERIKKELKAVTGLNPEIIY